MKKLILTLALLTPFCASAQSDTKCLANAIWFEARGQPVKTQAAVLQVIRNRAKRDKKSICDVVKEKGQFPWAAFMKNKSSWRVSQEKLELYFEAFKHLPVLGDDYFYFNHIPQPYGKKRHRKIGQLYFS